MAKPTSVPEWAGTGDIIEPSSGKKTLGWVPDERPPAQYMNWIQNLAGQWLSWLNSMFDADDEHVFPTPKDRFAFLLPTMASPWPLAGATEPSWYMGDPTSGTGFVAKSIVNGGRLFLPIGSLLPDGARFNMISAFVKPGQAEATQADRMKLKAYRLVVDNGIPITTTYTLDTTVYADDTDDLQYVTTFITAPPGPEQVKSGDPVTASYVTLEASVNASAAADQCHGFVVRYEDHGLRNL